MRHDRGSQMRILIADKFDDFRRILTIALRMEGHEVEETQDCATSKLRTDPFDLVLVDIDAGEDPVQTLSEIHECRPGTPVCLMSADLRTLERKRLRGNGAVQTLEKPFALQDLRAVMKGASGVMGQ